MPYVARSKQAKNKLQPVARLVGRPVTLSCGCQTDRLPELSNPARYWCCGQWRKAA